MMVEKPNGATKGLIPIHFHDILEGDVPESNIANHWFPA
jgi:hypothetical protein